MSTRTETVVVRNGRILGGRPVFRGTRVQVELLFENLAEGYSIDEVLENFPTLDREDLRKALFEACALLGASAPDITPSQEPEEAVRARVLR